MSASTPPIIHACFRVGACSCGYQIERGQRWGKKQRRRTDSSDLPEEILTEILLRLPVKPLIRFKTVCKSWYDLIDSPTFVKTHSVLNKTTKQVSFYFHSYHRGGDWTMSFRFSRTPVDLKLPPGFDEFPEVMGCSYGLVCISLFRRWHTKFVIWNPATRHFRIIRVNGGHASRCDFIYCGFSFDDSVAANTHKLVRITIISHLESSWKKLPRGETSASLHIFTLHASSWRVKDLVLPYEIPHKGTDICVVTCVERFIYCVLDVPDDKHILCFDLADELFHRIEFPVACRGVRCSTALHEYKGSLAMLAWERTANCVVSSLSSFDVWLLNDSGGDRQWSKQLTLRPPLDDVRGPIGFFTEDGVYLMGLCTKTGFFVWNTDSGETRLLCKNIFAFSQFFRYSESLASIY